MNSTPVTGRSVVLDVANVDTDQIVAVPYLVRKRGEGFGDVLFANLRTEFAGRPQPQGIIDWESWRDAKLLVSGPNFGCGSSREQAAWALLDFGFRAVIAPSFSSIFENNALKNGLLAITLPDDAVRAVIGALREAPDLALSIDLESEHVSTSAGHAHAFHLDAFWRRCLAEGLTELDLTRSLAPEIETFERRHRRAQPWLADAGSSSGGYQS